MFRLPSAFDIQAKASAAGAAVRRELKGALIACCSVNAAPGEDCATAKTPKHEDSKPTATVRRILRMKTEPSRSLGNCTFEILFLHSFGRVERAVGRAVGRSGRRAPIC